MPGSGTVPVRKFPKDSLSIPPVVSRISMRSNGSVLETPTKASTSFVLVNMNASTSAPPFFNVTCDLTPTRTGQAYAGSVMGREIVYERSREQVQADIDRLNPDLRRPRR